MTMLATRMGEIRELEGFVVEFMDRNGTPIDVRTNGIARYPFQRYMKNTATVQDWKDNRFVPTYGGYTCVVAYGNGEEAPGQTLLSTVRASYFTDADAAPDEV